MNNHFQSSETTCTSTGFSGEAIGLKGSRSWDPIQITPPRNRKIRIAMIVGTTITSMIPNALSRIFALPAPIGPCGSSTPPEQLLSDRRMIGAADTRQSRGRRCKRNAAHDDMESGGCNFVRLCLTEITLNRSEEH